MKPILSFSVNTLLLGMGQYSVAWLFCNWLVSFADLLLSFGESSCRNILCTLVTLLSFVVGPVLYSWWMWLLCLVYSGNSICNTNKVSELLS